MNAQQRITQLVNERMKLTIEIAKILEGTQNLKDKEFAKSLIDIARCEDLELLNHRYCDCCDKAVPDADWNSYAGSCGDCAAELDRICDARAEAEIRNWETQREWEQ